MKKNIYKQAGPENHLALLWHTPRCCSQGLRGPGAQETGSQLNLSINFDKLFYYVFHHDPRRNPSHLVSHILYAAGRPLQDADLGYSSSKADMGLLVGKRLISDQSKDS